MFDSPHTYVIGVDGGGTGCRVAIGTLSGKVLARADGGRANVSSGTALAITNITKAIEDAAAACGIAQTQLHKSSFHLGLAGVMTAQDAHKVASAFPYRHVTVTDDRPTALHGALGGQDGFLLSVGTGTIAAAFTDDAFRSIGGWGFHVGDQASGSWIGQEILRQTLLCHDGIAPHSDLTRTLLAGFQNDPNEIVAFSLTAKPGDYGCFAPRVVESARAGDAMGQMIMLAGADHLRKCLMALRFTAGDALCLTGGVGPHYAAYLPPELMTGLSEPKGNALDGAFEFARANLEKRLKELS